MDSEMEKYNSQRYALKDKLFVVNLKIKEFMEENREIQSINTKNQANLAILELNLNKK